jgi:hypothetical protein
MKQSNHYIKVNALKAKTNKFVTDYKCKLNANNQTNKSVLNNFKMKFLSGLVAGF